MKLKTHGDNINEVIFDNQNSLLFSYETPVAAYVHGVGFYRTSYAWSATTTRHINKWLKKVGNGDAKVKPQDWFSFMGANNGVPVEEVK